MSEPAEKSSSSKVVEDRKPITSWQNRVDRYEVRLVFGDHRNGLVAVRGSPDRVALRTERRREDFREAPVVVNTKDRSGQNRPPIHLIG